MIVWITQFDWTYATVCYYYVMIFIVPSFIKISILGTIDVLFCMKLLNFHVKWIVTVLSNVSYWYYIILLRFLVMFNSVVCGIAQLRSSKVLKNQWKLMM